MKELRLITFEFVFYLSKIRIVRSVAINVNGIKIIVLMIRCLPSNKKANITSMINIAIQISTIFNVFILVNINYSQYKVVL